MGFSIDTTPLRNLARDLRKIDASAARALTGSMAAIGTMVAEQAKENARSFPRIHEPTDRIESSIKVVRRGLSIRVVAGGDSAPESAPLEHNGLEGVFRHPVFDKTGERVASNSRSIRRGLISKKQLRQAGVADWVTQTARPFLAPAADAKADEIEAALLDAIDAGLAAVGFEGD